MSKTKIADFTALIRLPSSEMTKNRQNKNVSLNRDLLNFFHKYGIFQMLPGESSCPGGSEYVCLRGVDGVLGRFKFTRFSKKKSVELLFSMF